MVDGRCWNVLQRLRARGAVLLVSEPLLGGANWLLSAGPSRAVAILVTPYRGAGRGGQGLEGETGPNEIKHPGFVLV